MLQIATDGPCKGHPCDNCRICQRGRCCRNDNPDYRLPELGDWDGPVYGEFGILADDGDKAQCHCCGEFFGHLGNHVWRTHNLTAPEYKAIFGLNASTGLIGPTLLAKRSQRASEPGGIVDYKGNGRPLTPEQASAMLSGRKVRLQARVDPKKRVAITERTRKAGETRVQRGIQERVCVICGASFRVGRQKRNKQTCSDACLRQLRRRDAYENPAFTAEFQKPGEVTKRLRHSASV